MILFSDSNIQVLRQLTSGNAATVTDIVRILYTALSTVFRTRRFAPREAARYARSAKKSMSNYAKRTEVHD